MKRRAMNPERRHRLRALGLVPALSLVKSLCTMNMRAMPSSLAAAASLAVGPHARGSAASRNVSPSAPRLPDITLVDQDGRRVALRELVNDGVVAINFIYTGCASFCPPQTAVFRELREQIDAAPGVQAMLLSISIDPVNDTPAALSAYARRFEVTLGENARWLMLTGRVPDIDRVLTGFGLHRGALDDHPAQVWVGNLARRRWRRALGLAPAADLLRWIRELTA